MHRFCLPLAAFLLVSGAVWAQETPPPKAVVDIPAGANPAQITGLAAMLSSNADRLAGPGPWTPPTGDPSKITKADFLETLKPALADEEVRYGQEPIEPKQYAYECIPVLAAFYEATKDPKYLKLLVNAYKEYCAFIEEVEIKEGLAEMEKAADHRPGAGRYWTYIYVFLTLPLETMKGTPEYEQVKAMLGRALYKRAEAWPIYWEYGPQNRSMAPAYWYEMALKWSPDPPTPKAKELRAYLETVWADWWQYRDVEEDCPSYTSIDLSVADQWAVLRGVKPWEDKEARNLWTFYGREIANDGSYPAYADAGQIGNYFMGMFVAGFAINRCHDGQSQWLSRRAFFNGRDRIAQMCAGIGSMNYVYLAMAYLMADDTVKEVPPQAGLTVSQRRYHLRNDFNNLGPQGAFFKLENRPAPSKLLFRAGPKETDQYMLVQAAGQAGHGHPDGGAILQYSGDYAFYQVFGVTRLDDDMEQQNDFCLRLPDSAKPWGPTPCAEDYAVPVSGQTPEGAYGRIHLAEYPGVNVEEAWKKAVIWDKGAGGWPPNQACGYRNWPVRLDRSIVFVNNQFSVVRDVMIPTLAVKAQVGQNWVVGNFGPTVGPNWVNVWARNPLSGYYYSAAPQPDGSFTGGAPIFTAQRDLLIWFAPRADGMMQLVQGAGKSWYGDYFQNLANRVWYPRTADWEAGKPVAFTTVLLPHIPMADPAELAERISLIKDTPEVTAVQVKDAAGGSRTIVMNSSGRTVTVGTLTTDAEAVLIARSGGKTTVSAWHATVVKYDGKELRKAGEAGDVYKTL